MPGTELGKIAPGVYTAGDLERMKRKFDRTCEELGVFPEDEEARRSLGHAVVRTFEQGDIDLGPSGSRQAPTGERLRFEGEEVIVHPGIAPEARG